jgi:MFS transporter, NNP family, nitrate/nitrite transporter
VFAVNSNVAAVVGAIGGRIVMGTILDTYGPRISMAAVLLLTSPAVFCISIVQTPVEFAVVRFFIGLGLSAFVCCQYWCSQMFNVKIVGTANALAAGWGNLGGGLTHFVMPWLAQGIQFSQNEFMVSVCALLFSVICS